MTIKKGNLYLLNQVKLTKLDNRSKELRWQILKTIERARRGHIGSAFSIVEIIRVLYDDFLKYDPEQPFWKERDRFILSKGHGCLSLYVILAEKGFFPKSELDKFCQQDGILGGHPQYKTIPGIEVSTGSLGHGLSIGVGIALNAKIEGLKYKTVVLISDGECNEGSTWEAFLSARKHNLNNLIILIDYNKMQSYSSTYEVIDLEPLSFKLQSFGFTVDEVNGHNVKELKKNLIKAFNRDKPHVIICHTIKGKGISFIENNAFWHHKSKITDEEMKNLYEGLNKY